MSIDPQTCELRVAAVTLDQQLLLSLRSVGEEPGTVIEVESDMYRLLERVIDGKAQVVVVDLDALAEDAVSAIGLLRRTMPRVPLVLTTGDESVVADGRILEGGFFYFGLKPLGRTTLHELFQAAARSVGIPR